MNTPPAIPAGGRHSSIHSKSFQIEKDEFCSGKLVTARVLQTMSGWLRQRRNSDKPQHHLQEQGC